MKASIDYLVSITKAIEEPLSPDDELIHITKSARYACRSELSVIAFYDPLTSEIYYRRICGMQNRKSKVDNELFTRTQTNQGIFGWIARNLQSVNIPEEKNDRYSQMIEEEHLGIDIRSILATPMISNGKVFGVLSAINKRKNDTFSKYDQKLLKIIASVTAMKLDMVKLNEEINNKDRFSDLGKNIANSAHGLKNILNNIDGGTFIVESGVSKKRMNTVIDGWDIMKRNTYRLRELVLDMLLFARSNKPVYKAADVNQICTDLIELIHDTAEQENVILETDLDPKIGLCCFDQKGIYRCILNLMSNAIQACSGRPGSVVKIKTECVNEELIELSVCDNGRGISNENLNHIFEIFFTTKGSKGTGLGLPVTKKIIEEHGGKIKVDSEINKGSTFTISLPRIRKDHCL